MRQNGSFAKLVEEYGSSNTTTVAKAKVNGEGAASRAATKAEKLDPLMQLEERNTGAVSFSVYKRYVQAAGGLVWIPPLATCLLLNEGVNGTSLIRSRWPLHLNEIFSVRNVVLGILDLESVPSLYPRDVHGSICRSRLVLSDSGRESLCFQHQHRGSISSHIIYSDVRVRVR